MNLWRWFGSLLVLASLAGLVGLPALAQDKDKKEDKKKEDKKEEKAQEKAKNGGGDTLEWKAFNKGAKPFFQELTTETEQKMKVMGQEVTQKQKQTFYLQYTPEEPTKEGHYVVTQEIIGVKMNIDIGGVTIAFDSEDTKQGNNPMTDFFKKLIEAKLKLTINPKTMEVTKIEGHDELVKKLGQTNPQMEPLLKSILSEAALKQMAEPTWGALPPAGVAKGKTWPKSSNLNLGPIGTYKTDYTFTYEGQEKDLDKIKIDAKLTYSAPTDKGGLPFTIKSAELTSKEGTGYAYFDRKKGRFESSTMKMKLEGTLKIEVGGMETDVTLTQDQTATVKSSDDRPVKGAAAPAPAK
jgi:hypothetical protein